MREASSTEPLALDVLEDGVFVAVLPRKAARLYQSGTRVVLVPWQGRSRKSHDHFFAVVDDAWANLPEEAAARFPTSEHLRKWCLIKAGYCTSRDIVCASRAEARRWAVEMQHAQEYALVDARETVVKVYVAKSQSEKAMGAKVFAESKSAVFDVIANLLGVDPNTLRQQAGNAA